MAGQPGFMSLLRSLNHRNYRFFFTGQAVSLIGTWMQQAAMSWLVYRLTNSSMYLGVVGFASQIPIFLFASLAGVYADRHNRHRILVATQVVSLLQACFMALLTFSGIVHVWHIILLSIMLGVVNAFDMPARQSFIIDIVEDKRDLGNAIALNSFIFNGARLIGPSIAGVLIGLAGEGSCFLVNSISFAAIIVALIAMRIPAKAGEPARESFLTGLLDGYRYAFHTAPIRSILMHLAVISFMGMPYGVLMPYFARDVLSGGPHTLGFLMAASGTGALTGTIYLASRRSIRGLDKLIVVASYAFGAGVIVFAFSRSMVLSMGMLLFTGFGLIVQMAACNTILQTIVQEDKRGRVMSLYATAIAGMAPFGSLFSGILAAHIGPPLTLTISGITCALGALYFGFNFRMPGGVHGEGKAQA